MRSLVPFGFGFNSDYPSFFDDFGFHGGLPDFFDMDKNFVRSDIKAKSMPNNYIEMR